MLIDWFTVVAQAVNFIILVWLLKRFLYKPILDAIDAREKRIEMELADADAKKAEALKERDAFLRKNEAFDGQRAALLSAAEAEANTERRRLLDEARRAADDLSAKRRQALRSDARDLSRAIGERTQNEVFAISRKALMDLATTTLEARVCDVFVRRLREMEGPAKAGLVKSLKTASRARRLFAARSPCQRSNAPRYKRRWTKSSGPRSNSASRSRRNWSRGSNSPGTDRRSAGASRTISRRCKSASPSF